MKLTDEEMQALKDLVPKDIQVIWGDGGFCEIRSIDAEEFYLEFTIKAKALNFIEFSIDEMWVKCDDGETQIHVVCSHVLYRWDEDQVKEFGIHVLNQVDCDDNLQWIVEGKKVKNKKSGLYD